MRLFPLLVVALATTVSSQEETSVATSSQAKAEQEDAPTSEGQAATAVTTLSAIPVAGEENSRSTTASAAESTRAIRAADPDESQATTAVSNDSTTTMATQASSSSDPEVTPDENPDSATKGPAVADRRVQTTEVPDEAAAAPTDASGPATPDSHETSASPVGTDTSGPASQSPQSPRNPKYVDIDSVKHPEEPPPEIPSKPFPQNITVRLENLACEHPQHERPGLRIDIEKTFRQLAENISDVQLADASCKMFLTLNLTVTATDGDFKRLLAKLEEHVKNITVGEHMVITGFTLHDGAEHQVDLMTRPTVTRAGRFPTYREELIILVAVIVLLCIVLFIACVICSIRCCRRSPSSKTLDLLEAAQTPRSHSRNADFNNRIPRAHTLYSPTASEYSGCLSPMTPFGPGVVQPFDTCLVPLEDVTPSSAPRAMGTHGAVGGASRGVPATRPNNLPLRPHVDFSPDRSRFRSYNYPPKHTRTLPSAVTSKHFPKNNATQSTEQLTKNHSLDDDSGVDNPTYLPTPSTPHVTSDIAETHKM